ncbi:hypothetical protein A2W67_03470 [Candidatus Nomurabacteria bacterium RIFCSPLOWO2_02_40_28]|uniref:Putative membrane protein n=2 Tax=Candidatus Nomuraibacteriota TaxID=1752729 RepID=A0A837HWW4_9BACT|nr:MAG: putative membrane protein [Candidatus Nomurabacteria bacterium GW2011_GWD2_39_12]KKR20932.1 MAG: putative membrane protein [Candidatus Nomurabacteria bacterium GW2011_GWC2_39_41]KKR37189.1 MAG: putative membrane protein [Candidatus Nomurabacteria bacterium GW2011_GWE2_40_10]KKR38881.1 MAG: putative membrane protein [Candidatus Nomurabacteria bacterium GW2011_GWB1_40_11]KKR40123.1 MAG: putative membrane protein [Parcubacteria group bacterium GW2011_GWC1_40_11]KKR59268.1 MAG: putative me
MQKKIKRAVVLTLGIIFIIFGLLGLALPFLQGIIFLFIGLVLLSFSSPKIRLWLEKHTAKYPHLFKLIKKTENLVAKIFGEI